MHLEELHYIMVVAKVGSFTKAAEKLCITQSALSRVVQRWEAEYQTELFYRHRSFLRPTPGGKLFLVQAKKIISLQKALKIQLAAYANTEQEEPL